ncbi:Phage Mu protein F like protein [Paracoccus thiocyanatus]|uniref:Phage Mu protein F like protein n=1 Tax=Paracoccus thiocyanatus TaxID=34006 RepID=A0A1N6ZKW1_9RHOB|nr:phage minor head protein [Paracoccus thiocyanatus]SIR27512.1 Phage Mu protein F like protein [Paracoccus thiocyanatus]
MHHDFKDSLRNGGNGEYIIHQGNGPAYGSSLSVRSQFPGDDRLRQAFRQRLETVAAENARMILSALAPPDTVPLHSESDLLPATDLIEQVLQVRDDRLADIHARYRSHPQRIRSLRANMEDRTALAFAGLINQLRQEDLGIERYVWVTQGDHKVRSAHAALNGKVFGWDHPSEEGHRARRRIAAAAPCRCRRMLRAPFWPISPCRSMASARCPRRACARPCSAWDGFTGSDGRRSRTLPPRERAARLQG